MLYTINFLIFKLFRAKKNHENALDLFVLFFPPQGTAPGDAAELAFDLSNDQYILWNFTCV